MMKEMLARSALLIALLLFCAVEVNADAILQNPGFESWEGDVPDGWQIELRENIGQFGIHSVTPNSYGLQGQRAASITVSSSSSTGGCEEQSYIFQKVSNCTIGQTYNFSFWFNSQIQQSSEGSSVHPRMYAGIDPYGGTTPNPYDEYYFDRNFIAWSPETTVTNGWTRLSVGAMAQNSDMVVIIKDYSNGWIDWYWKGPRMRDVALGYFNEQINIDSADLTPIPEPTSIMLMGMGLYMVGRNLRRDLSRWIV